MSISSDEVRKVAHLARLEVPAAQLGEHAAQLSTILELVEQLAGADTGQVPPLAHPIEARNFKAVLSAPSTSHC